MDTQIADIPTVSEFTARTLLADDYIVVGDLSGLSTFDPTSDVVAHVTLVDTCTTNSDMRGTDNATLASVWTNTKAGYLDTAISSVLAATDFWGIALPGAYTSGEAGYILAGIKTKVDTLGGAGAITWTYTVTDSSTGLPISDVDIWVSTDVSGANIVATGKTNTSGVCTFYLDAGTYYIWSQKSGYSFTNPDTEVVA